MGQRSKRKWWNYKNPREKLKGKSIWIQIWQSVLCYDAKAQAIKEKINWTSWNQIKLCLKGHYQEHEKTTHKVGKYF